MAVTHSICIICVISLKIVTSIPEFISKTNQCLRLDLPKVALETRPLVIGICKVTSGRKTREYKKVSQEKRKDNMGNTHKQVIFVGNGSSTPLNN